MNDPSCPPGAVFLTTYLYFMTLSAVASSVEYHVDLGLAGGPDLVVVHLDRQPDLPEPEEHPERRSW